MTAWQEMGCWTPRAKNGHADNKLTIAAGATFRPIAQTIADTADWAATRGADYKWRAGMSAQREKELLTAWHGR